MPVLPAKMWVKLPEERHVTQGKQSEAQNAGIGSTCGGCARWQKRQFRVKAIQNQLVLIPTQLLNMKKKVFLKLEIWGGAGTYHVSCDY